MRTTSANEILSSPGTVTVRGVAKIPLTVHVPAPPPASVSLTTTSGFCPERTSPNETAVGSAKSSGVSARPTAIRPPPVRSGPLGSGDPVVTSADFSCAGVHAGWRLRRSATAPATCGEAMLVPLSTDQSSSGVDERIDEPGAATSGLSRSETGVGPADENDEIEPAGSSRPFATDATAIAEAALAGEPTEPSWKRPNSLPAAATVGTPAAAAPSIASATRSRVGSISGSPSERLITSIPSATAASIPAAISGALPLRPKPSVGTVSTL